MHRYHSLGLPTLVGERLTQLVTIDDQVVACLGWTSAAWKVGARDRLMGWDQATRRRNLYLVVNNATTVRYDRSMKPAGASTLNSQKL